MAGAYGYDSTCMAYRIGSKTVTLAQLRKFFRLRFRADGIAAMLTEAYRRYTKYFGSERVLPDAIEEWTIALKFQNKIPPFVLAVWYAEEHAAGNLEVGFRVAREGLET